MIDNSLLPHPWMLLQDNGTVSLVICDSNLPTGQEYKMWPIADQDAKMEVRYAHNVEECATTSIVYLRSTKLPHPLALTIDLFKGIYDAQCVENGLTDIEDGIFDPYRALYQHLFRTSNGLLGEKPRELKKIYLTNVNSFDKDIGTYFTLSHSGVQ